MPNILKASYLLSLLFNGTVNASYYPIVREGAECVFDLPVSPPNTHYTIEKCA